MSVLVVLTNLPDSDSAFNLGRHVVVQGLAACANVLGPVRSVYRWRGKIEEASEVPLLIKTTRERYAELEAAIVSMHPDEVPEIIAFPVERGLATYLAWVAVQTDSAPARDPVP